MPWWVYLIIGAVALTVLGLICTAVETVGKVFKAIWLVFSAPFRLIGLAIKRLRK